ncbi:DUF2291 domain-containing protein [Halocella sp. SP3-1]|uniref:DUF2291 family protein n=1 Tax=Halocella sp. SP3-1 TaxID=2382161 RepID=UPI000F75E8C5|nr:DUF2291 domain-containing protein [Halocella sp. SP3-1]AZO95819.1 DUF2291 domain-containing protein [Halocella sp. SP3-1]
MKLKNDFSKLILLILLLACSMMVLSSCRLWTVVELNKDSSSENEIIVTIDGEERGLESYVDSIWNDKIISYINKEAIDVNLVIKEIDKNLDAAGEKYGIKEAAGKPWKFIVKGKGKILSVNTESRNGTIDVDIEPYDGKKDLKIQIGPVIRGSSIRDSLNYISFNNFGNQIEYAKFSTEINNKINKEFLQNINFEELEGSVIDFQGIFVVQSSEIVLTPVKIEVIGGRK